LSDVFDYARYDNLPGFSEAPLDVVEAVLGSKMQARNVDPAAEVCRKVDRR